MRARHFRGIGLVVPAATLMLLHLGCNPAPAPTAAPAATPTPGAPQVVYAWELETIEVTSTTGLVRRTSPGRTDPVPLGQGTLQVTVRGLFPDPGAVSVRAEPAEGAADAAAWQVERQEPPAPDTVAFRLHGGRPGQVGIVLEGPGRAPVRFTLDVTEIPIIYHVDRGQVLRLGVGERFVLDVNLGLMREVRVWLTDPAVLRLVRERDDGRPPFFLVGGRAMHIENEYQAVRPGRTTLQAHGEAPRGMGKPNFDFALDVEVR